MPPVPHASLIVRGLLLLIVAAGVYFFRGFLVPVLAALIIGFASWPLFLPILLIFSSFIGGCAGSTGGGMKVVRVVLLFLHTLSVILSAMVWWNLIKITKRSLLKRPPLGLTSAQAPHPRTGTHPTPLQRCDSKSSESWHVGA